MRTRITVGITLIAAIAGLFVLDYCLDERWFISGLVVLLGFAGWCELAKLAGIASRERGGSALLFLVGSAATAWLLGLGWWEGARGLASPWAAALGLFGVCLGAAVAVVFRRDYTKGFEPLLMTILGTLLYGYFFSYLLRIYHLEGGMLKGVVFILGVKGNDISAYFVGRTWGRVRCIAVSPKKTLEGCAAAVIFCAVWFCLAGWIWPESFFPWPVAAPLGIILSFTTQVGDLTESLLKRRFGVKDSSSLLPEFGGILDLTDSVLFSGYLYWLLETTAPLGGR
jgi:phosphatidate cytidylyltransferase